MSTWNYSATFYLNTSISMQQNPCEALWKHTPKSELVNISQDLYKPEIPEGTSNLKTSSYALSVSEPRQINRKTPHQPIGWEEIELAINDLKQQIAPRPEKLPGECHSKFKQKSTSSWFYYLFFPLSCWFPQPHSAAAIFLNSHCLQSSSHLLGLP